MSAAAEDLTIAELAGLIARGRGLSGRARVRPAKPDGTPRKLLDTTKLDRTGWRPRIALEDGLRQTYRWYLGHQADARGMSAPPVPVKPLAHAGELG